MSIPLASYYLLVHEINYGRYVYAVRSGPFPNRRYTEDESPKTTCLLVKMEDEGHPDDGDVNGARTSFPQHIQNEIENRVGARIVAIEECKSAQQQVWIVTLNQHGKEWKDALEAGRNRLIIRLWQGGCQWWNLNQNLSPHRLARTELMGYQFGRQALNGSGITIPRVMSVEFTNADSMPWAILEYVGPGSVYLDSTNSTWIDTMVPQRLEFGFEEPHPRWGRVPVSRALEYATMVLDQVVIPLHLGSLHDGETHRDMITKQQLIGSYTYESMINTYQETYEDILQRLVLAHYHKELEIEPNNNQQWDHVMALLQNAVYQVLPSNNSEMGLLQPPLPSMVLVHLDLQPQNLLFSWQQSNSQTTHASCRVSSVLDWEDAAIADPRFELLLLGRKVCANREQAEQLWQHYMNKTDGDLGPLKPWLQLETTHSILTMLLQSMNMLNGGRNPWETTNDLWAKIEREITRWQAMLAEDDSQQANATIRNGNRSTNHSKKGEAIPVDDVLADLGIHPEKCYRSLD